MPAAGGAAATDREAAATAFHPPPSCALAAETSDAPPPSLVRLLLHDAGTPFDPALHPASARNVPPCLRTLSDLWAQGHRADMLARWTEALLPDAAAERPASARSSRLLRFRSELQRCGGRITTSELQVWGAYIRCFGQGEQPTMPPLPGSLPLRGLAHSGLACGSEPNAPPSFTQLRSPGFGELLCARRR